MKILVIQLAKPWHSELLNFGVGDNGQVAKGIRYPQTPDFLFSGFVYTLLFPALFFLPLSFCQCGS